MPRRRMAAVHQGRAICFFAIGLLDLLPLPQPVALQWTIALSESHARLKIVPQLIDGHAEEVARFFERVKFSPTTKFLTQNRVRANQGTDGSGGSKPVYGRQMNPISKFLTQNRDTTM